jgi:fucose permease
MGSLFLTFFVGMEQMHLQFLPTFAVNSDLNLSPSEAALISSATAVIFRVLQICLIEIDF